MMISSVCGRRCCSHKMASRSLLCGKSIRPICEAIKGILLEPSKSSQWCSDDNICCLDEITYRFSDNRNSICSATRDIDEIIGYSMCPGMICSSCDASYEIACRSRHMTECSKYGFWYILDTMLTVCSW